MTKGKDFIGSPEFEALKDIPGVDPAEIMKQAGLGGDPTPPGGGDPQYRQEANPLHPLPLLSRDSHLSHHKERTRPPHRRTIF
jgi:hypothetical protein